MKLLISSSADRRIKFWTSGGQLADTVELETGIFVMALNNERQQLIIGVNKGIRIYNLITDVESEHHIDASQPYTRHEHTDIVKCVAYYQDRIYTAGYDRKLLMYGYDKSISNIKGRAIDIIHTVSEAHNAGITCMSLMVDAERNVFVLTGSYDKVVKIWSNDGQLRRKIEANFVSKITSVIFATKTKTILIAQAESNQLVMFDPKGGENITHSATTLLLPEEGYCSLLRYNPESNQILVNAQRRLILGKYNLLGPVTILRQTAPIESICYTGKQPLLIFTGSSSGELTKWESQPHSKYIYLSDNYSLQEGLAINGLKNKSQGGGDFTNLKKNQIAFMDIKYHEELEYLLVACEDGQIYLWGFETGNYDDLFTTSSRSRTDEQKEENDIKTLIDELSSKSRKSSMIENHVSSGGDGASVSSRVAGFMCKYIFHGHTDTVSSIVLINDHTGHYFLSAGWDKTVRAYNLANFENIHIYNDAICYSTEAILSIDYNSSNSTFAYAAGRSIHLWKWSSNYKDIRYLTVMNGHLSEVTSIKWHPVADRWISGGDDGQIRTWHNDGTKDICMPIEQPISCVTCNTRNDTIIVGVYDQLRVYNCKLGTEVAVYKGHADTIRSIIHLPEKSQYVSVSLDQTVNIWDEYQSTV